METIETVINLLQKTKSKIKDRIKELDRKIKELEEEKHSW